MPLNNRQAFLIIRQDTWWEASALKRVMVEWVDEGGYSQVWVRESRIEGAPWWLA
jgi:hypothetical protein